MVQYQEKGQQRVAECWLGYFAPDGNATSCITASAPQFQLKAWYVAGQTGVAGAQLPVPWTELFVVARIASGDQMGQLLLMRGGNQTWSLLPSSSVGSVVLGRLQGLCVMNTADHSGVVVVMTETLNGVSSVLVSDLTPSADGLFNAHLRPRIGPPTRTASPPDLSGLVSWGTGFAVADRSNGCVWLLQSFPAPTPASISVSAADSGYTNILGASEWSTLLHADNISTSMSLGGAFALSAYAASDTLAVLTSSHLLLCTYSTAGVQSSWGCLSCGGASGAYSQEGPCSLVNLKTAKSVSLVNEYTGYLLFDTTIAQFDMISEKVTMMASVPGGNFGSAFLNPSQSGFLLTNGMQSGTGVYALGLGGCLCAAGLYCSQQQCVQTPAGTYSAAWAASPTKCPPGAPPLNFPSAEFPRR